LLQLQAELVDLQVRVQGGGMIECLILILATEALTKLLRDAEVFNAPRAWLSGRWELLAELVSCGYCLSVWVAGIVLMLHCFSSGWLLALLALHRAANLCHDLCGIVTNFKINQRLRRD